MKYLKLYENFNDDYEFITDLFIEVADKWNLKEETIHRQFTGNSYRFVKLDEDAENGRTLLQKTTLVLIRYEIFNYDPNDHSYDNLDKFLDSKFLYDLDRYMNRVCNYYNGIEDENDTIWKSFIKNMTNDYNKTKEITDDHIQKIIKLGNKVKKQKISSNISKSFSDIRANPYIDQPHRRIMELTIEFKLY